MTFDLLLLWALSVHQPKDLCFSPGVHVNPQTVFLTQPCCRHCPTCNARIKMNIEIPKNHKRIPICW